MEIPGALAGMAMSTYTGALLSATSTPLWAAAPRRIAAAFGALAMGSGATALTVAEQGGSASDAGHA
jgi:formate-dependent nitrite reductase membrane component NrfD